MTMTRSGLPVRTPEPVTETEPFWTGLGVDELRLRRCDSCREISWYPREMCPECHSVGGTWEVATGRGHVYSYTIVHRGQEGYEKFTPYVLAWVQLDEGPRVMTNIVGVDPFVVSIGMRVKAFFDHSAAGTMLRFEPT